MNAELLVLGVVVLGPYLALVRPGWRALVLLVIPVGFYQEPLRKSIMGQPVTVQLAAVAVFALALVAVTTRFGLPSLTPLSGQSRYSRKLLLTFILVICLQSIHALARFGTLMVPMIGLLSYLLPIPALWVAYKFVRRPDDIRRFLVLYVSVAVILTSGVIANYQGIHSDLFSQVGDAPMVVYHQTVGVVDLYCGYLRSPEIAAWHAAALACLTVTLAFSFKSRIIRATAPFVVIYAMATVILTGRRKALVIMVIYAVFYVAGLLLSRRRSSKAAAFAGIVIAGLLLGGSLVLAPEDSAPSPHFERSATTFDDVYERFESLGLNTIKWAYASGGIFGLGTGAGAQGTQHIAGVATQYAAEGGLGRIMLEVGPIGLILAVLCALAVAKQARRCVLLAGEHGQVLFRLSLGIISFIGANVPIFIGAAQVFGDPFVLMILGMQLGFVLSVPRIIALEQARGDVASNMQANTPRTMLSHWA